MDVVPAFGKMGPIIWVNSDEEEDTVLENTSLVEEEESQEEGGEDGLKENGRKIRFMG